MMLLSSRLMDGESGGILINWLGTGFPIIWDGYVVEKYYFDFCVGFLALDFKGKIPWRTYWGCILI